MGVERSRGQVFVGRGWEGERGFTGLVGGKVLSEGNAPFFFWNK